NFSGRRSVRSLGPPRRRTPAGRPADPDSMGPAWAPVADPAVHPLEEARISPRLMDTFAKVLRWLTDGVHWHGSGGIPVRTFQHVEISMVALGLAAAVAVPIGLWVGHARKFEFVAVSIANIGRAV